MSAFASVLGGTQLLAPVGGLPEYRAFVWPAGGQVVYRDEQPQAEVASAAVLPAEAGAPEVLSAPRRPARAARSRPVVSEEPVVT